MILEFDFAGFDSRKSRNVDHITQSFQDASTKKFFFLLTSSCRCFGRFGIFCKEEALSFTITH